MHIVATHAISDSRKFFETARTLKDVTPPEIQSLLSLPSADGKHMLCLWKGATIDQVRTFLDRATQGSATNTYYEVDESRALGLTELGRLQKAA